jgi:hypothetical protein
MAAFSGIRWIRPPSGLAKAIQEHEQKALVATHAVGMRVGVKMQNEGRRNAGWEDRTGNARGGLFFAVDGLGLAPVTGDVSPGNAAAFQQDAAGDVGAGGDKKTLVIVFGHTMRYGANLELDHGQRYAIVMPTIEANLPELQRLLDELFS